MHILRAFGKRPTPAVAPILKDDHGHTITRGQAVVKALHDVFADEPGLVTNPQQAVAEANTLVDQRIQRGIYRMAI